MKIRCFWDEGQNLLSLDPMVEKHRRGEDRSTKPKSTVISKMTVLFFIPESGRVHSRGMQGTQRKRRLDHTIVGGNHLAERRLHSLIRE
jgi:hypothetical protein